MMNNPTTGIELEGFVNKLFYNGGSNIQNFLSKLRDDDNLYKNDVIKVSVIGDSITNYWAGTYYWIELYLAREYPEKTFEYIHIQLGGTGAEYHLMDLNKVIGFNPDLVILGEWEGTGRGEQLEQIIRLLRQKTSSDIAIFPFSIYQGDAQKLYDNDIEAYKLTETYQLRRWFYSIAQKYNCGMFDFYLTWIPKLLDQTYEPTELLRDNVHPSDLGISLWEDVLDANLKPLYGNYELANKSNNDAKPTEYFREAIQTPDFTNIVSSGIWSINEVDTDKSYDVLQSNEVGAYVEAKIAGKGFKISLFGGNVGSVGVLLDGVAPSTLIKDYAGYYTGLLSRPYKVIINSNILTNAEIEREFSVTIGTIVRDGEDNITSAPYDLYDVTKSSIVGSGNFNTDESFIYDGGQISIPSQYAGASNLREFTTNDIPNVVGSVFYFKVRKRWFDTINITANNLTNIIEISGLEDKEHTVRLTVSSGTINLDSIMEL